MPKHEKMDTPVKSLTEKGTAFGVRLKARRKTNQLTLTELSVLAKVSASTISKIENGAVSPTYDVILRLANGLSMSVNEMFGDSLERATTNGPSGWQLIGRKEEFEALDTDNYAHHYLCSNLKMRSMVPVLVKIKAGSISEFGELTTHSGEEFVYVLEGKVEVHSEFYAAATLNKGDYAYLDSTMGHAYIRGSEQEATILCVCAGQTAHSGHIRPVIPI